MDEAENDAQQVAARERSRLGRGLLNTLPIVIVGSMAVGLGMTGPIHPTEHRRADKPKAAASELGKSIREAFQAASRATSNPVVAATPAEVAVAAAPTTYKVVAGDTVSSIAGRYGIATASVLALNGLSWKSTIFAGQTLKLTNGAPVALAAKPTAPTSSRYTIRSGDTMSKIATQFGVSVTTLLSANGLGKTSIIYPGQTIAIPGSTATAIKSPATETPIVANPAPTSSSSYVIQAGDTISKIASKSKVSVQALLAANGLTTSSVIFTGRTLKIPGTASVAAAASTPVQETTTVLTAEMTANAKTILKVGRSLGVPDYGLVVALAAAAQESGLRNLTYGDRDSLGLFQQRPSAGWGTRAQILSQEHAARLFFGGPTNPNAGITRGLLDIAGWQSKSVTDAAQSVQLSGYPTAYAKWETSARAWLAALR